MSDTSKTRSAVRGGGGGAVYGLGLIGALVYYRQHAHGFWAHMADVDAILWPPLSFTGCSATWRPELALSAGSYRIADWGRGRPRPGPPLAAHCTHRLAKWLSDDHSGCACGRAEGGQVPQEMAKEAGRSPPASMARPADDDLQTSHSQPRACDGH